MKNLEQIRAKNAMNAAKNNDFGGKNGGETVKKIPTMIRDNGILGALAFAKETGKGYEATFKAIITHLQDAEINRCPTDCDDLDEFFTCLVEKDSATLRDVTAESMAYLNYLRRFVHCKAGE